MAAARTAVARRSIARPFSLRAAADPPSVLRPEVLDALLELRWKDPEAFERLLAELKQVGVGLTGLRRASRRRARLTKGGGQDDDTGSRASHPLSLRRALHRDPRTRGLVRLNSFALQIMLEKPVPRPACPTAGLRAAAVEGCRWRRPARIPQRQRLPRRSKNLVHDVVVLEAESNAYHPVRDYLDGLRWDAKPRLNRFLFDHCGTIAEGEDDKEKADQTRYIEAITRCFFDLAVARTTSRAARPITRPCSKASKVPGKSKMLRTLAVKDEWFSDGLTEDLKSKDAKIHLKGRWIVELGELAQLRRNEVETIKAFLSRRIDQYRPPYGRTDIDVPRQNVFVGTVNNDRYLHDATGNRRYWPVQVNTINIDTIRPIVDQLWAEAVSVYNAGAPWHLSPEIEAIAKDEQLDRLARDPYQDALAKLAAKVPATAGRDHHGARASIRARHRPGRPHPSPTKCASATPCGPSARSVNEPQHVEGEPRGWIYRRTEHAKDEAKDDPAEKLL